VTEGIKRCCGTCAFGHVLAKDITKRLCHGNPPQILVVPSPQGIVFQNARPIVPATDPPCSHYEPRSMAQLAQDSEVADRQETPTPAQETRQ